VACLQAGPLLADGAPRKTEIQVLVDEIRDYHARCKRSFEDHVFAAFMCGVKFLEAKQLVAHGNSQEAEAGFQRWADKNLPDIRKTSRWQYTKVTEGLLARFPALGKSSPDELLAAGGLPKAIEAFTSAPAEQQKQLVLKAVHDYGDVKTMTELYRALDYVRPVKPKEHHPRKPVDAKAKVEEDNAEACRQLRFLAAQLQLARSKWLLCQVPPDLVQLLGDECVETSNLIRAGKRAETARRLAKPKG
jgi:hypothetical protein